MNISVLIASYGDPAWYDLSMSRAYPSAMAAIGEVDGLHEVTVNYDPKGTLASVRNDAAEDAKGDWLCFLDADDELAPGYLAAMEGSGADIWYDEEKLWPLLVPRVQYVTPKPVGELVTQPAFPNQGRWPEMNTAVIGALVPRALFLEVGGFREYPIWEDWEFFLRCDEAGARQVEVPGAIYRAHVSPSSRNESLTARERRELHAQIKAEHLGAWRNEIRRLNEERRELQRRG